MTFLLQEERQRKKEEQQAKEAAAQVHVNVINLMVIHLLRIVFNVYVV